jgi:ADP-glucose pyrophosphorylase
VLFGGKYRIIDFTLSNCKHSGIRYCGHPDPVSAPWN